MDTRCPLRNRQSHFLYSYGQKDGISIGDLADRMPTAPQPHDWRVPSKQSCKRNKNNENLTHIPGGSLFFDFYLQFTCKCPQRVDFLHQLVQLLSRKDRLRRAYLAERNIIPCSFSCDDKKSYDKMKNCKLEFYVTYLIS